MVGNGYNSRRVVVKMVIIVLVGMAVACLVLSNSLLPRSYSFTKFFAINSLFGEGMNKTELEIVLKNASMKENKTVILTTLNEAWAKPHSVFDLFLESFKIGNNTQRLLNHLLVICLDEKAYNRCLVIHPHCYHLRTPGTNFSGDAFFMTSDYLKMMWRRIEFLAVVLENGYNFIFTDTDIMWLRDPFPHFYPDADFQIACDFFLGDSYDVNYNKPNGGFSYVKSSKRTLEFYEFWYHSRKQYPGRHDQDVLDKIKHDPFITKIGLQLRFLDTAYFGGFCQPSKDLNLVCTMHANCCVGLENKVHDLQILLQDWRNFISLVPTIPPNASWTVPQYCRTSFQRPHGHSSRKKIKSQKRSN